MSPQPAHLKRDQEAFRDSISTVVRFDSITAPNRPGLRVGTTPTTLTYADECGIQSSLVGRGGLLKVVEGTNPSNQDFTFQYLIPVDGYATLSIYALSGKRVAQLAEGEHRAGIHRATFPTTNQPAGTYYCILQLGERSEVLEVVVR